MGSNSPYIMYDGARVSRESALGKELEKHERKPDWTPEKNPFPKMLHKATHRPDGKRSVGEVLDSLFGGSAGAAEQWSRRCQLTVYNETELSRALETGWRKHPKEALDLLKAQDNNVADLTAEEHYKEARMSPLAQREAEAAHSENLKFCPEIQEKPRQRKPMSPETKAKLSASLQKAREAKATKIAKNASGE